MMENLRVAEQSTRLPSSGDEIELGDGTTEYDRGAEENDSYNNHQFGNILTLPGGPLGPPLPSQPDDPMPPQPRSDNSW